MAPSTCCVSGTPSTLEPTGTVTTIHGLPTYVSKPEGDGVPKGLVVMIPDAFGWDFVNCRIVADKISKGGFLVYLPNFMNGASADPALMVPMENFQAPSGLLYKIFVKPLLIARCLPPFASFLFRNSPGKIHPKVTAFFTALHESPETKDMKIGATGYCWGGKFTVLLCHGPNPLINAGFTAHPSNLVVPDDIEKVEVPLCISIGDVDMGMNLAKVNEAKAILEGEKKKDVGHEVHILPGAMHGFAVRANPKDPRQQECCDLAEKQAIDFFTKWLA